ncbi:MAG TPA: ABC transporter permease [Thermoplasmata archaeon]|nr:ABC transporter permease [Thermoplasmata archaeon]
MGPPDSVAAFPRAGRSHSATDPPSTITQVLSLARYQFRDYLRARRFLLMVGIVAVIGVILTALVAHFGLASSSSAPLDFYSTYWGLGVPYVIAFAGIIFGADAIAGEFQNKTGYFLMGLPIRRVTVYFGKYLAALAASLTAVGLFAAILLANGAYYFGTNAFPWQLGASLVLAVVYLLALLGATFLFSSLFKTSTYATLVVAVLFLIGFSLLQDLVSGVIKSEPWFIISYASAVIADVFLNPYPPRSVDMHPFGPRGPVTTVYTPTLPEGVAIMLVYFVLTLLVGLWLFEREEFS